MIGEANLALMSSTCHTSRGLAVLDLAGVEAGHPALEIVVRVLLAVTDVERGCIDDGRAVDGPVPNR